MFCVIQEVRRRKPNPYGEQRAIEAYQNSWTVEGKPAAWSWRYTGGRFERPHLEAYKITLHQSYRENGRVKKRQYAICTMSYYDIVEYSLYDCASGRIEATADLLNMDAGELYDLIECKLEPLRNRIEAEFHQSPEYIAKQEHQRILDAHRETRSTFCKMYETDGDEYDRCYDVFGVLRNPGYLEQIKAQYEAKQDAERRYWESYRSNYQQYTSGGYSVQSTSTYSEDERAMLKKFYRALSKMYHPDMNPDKDTTEAMKLLNKLKDAWNV